MVSFDDSSITSGMERITECSGAVSHVCISSSDEVSKKVVFSGWNSASEAEVLFKEIKGRREDEVDASFQEYSQREGEAQEEFRHFDKIRKNWWKCFVNIRKSDEGKVRSKLTTATNKTRRVKILLSSSMDKTVCCWKIGCDQCLSVFPHKDFVTCIQFNPVDENYFISGSIDGKVRIWGIREERVVDWADIRDVISAISYQQDGKISNDLGKYFKLEAQIGICGKKKTSGNKITSIQFFQNNSQRIMITSEDSKIHILDGIEIVQKYKGLPRSGSQMSGSFTSSGKHIISVGEDSHGVTVAIPWSGVKAEDRNDNRNNFSHHSSETKTKLEFGCEVRDTEQRFSLGNWFFIDGTCRGSMTWPEEKLPTWDLPLVEDEYDRKTLCREDSSHYRNISETWGLTIVAAGSDGTIKTFHNFGLP
ncbi:hypothetical protein TSUD_70040, partial [Trifolium subterraneum]